MSNLLTNYFKNAILVFEMTYGGKMAENIELEMFSPKQNVKER